MPILNLISTQIFSCLVSGWLLNNLTQGTIDHSATIGCLSVFVSSAALLFPSQKKKKEKKKKKGTKGKCGLIGMSLIVFG